jgi:hypothetical protein
VPGPQKLAEACEPSERPPRRCESAEARRSLRAERARRRGAANRRGAGTPRAAHRGGPRGAAPGAPPRTPRGRRGSAEATREASEHSFTCERARPCVSTSLRQAS